MFRFLHAGGIIKADIEAGFHIIRLDIKHIHPLNRHLDYQVQLTAEDRRILLLQFRKG